MFEKDKVLICSLCIHHVTNAKHHATIEKIKKWIQIWKHEFFDDAEKEYFNLDPEVDLDFTPVYQFYEHPTTDEIFAPLPLPEENKLKTENNEKGKGGKLKMPIKVKVNKEKKIQKAVTIEKELKIEKEVKIKIEGSNSQRKKSYRCFCMFGVAQQNKSIKYKCKKCRGMFATVYNRNRHDREVHLKERKFVCDNQNCRRKFSRKASRDYHKMNACRYNHNQS